MNIDREVREYLTVEMKEVDTKARDINLILYYYGFGENLWPTLEDAAIEFSVGESDGRRSERPRQIINKKFRNIAKLTNFPSLVEFSKILNSSNCHFSNELLEACLEDGLIGDAGNITSLLRLMHDLGEGENYEAYSLDLDELTKNSFVKNQDILIADKDSIKALRKALKIAKTIPGLIGISKMEYLINEHGIGSIDPEILISIIKRDADSWFYNYQGDDYYLLESRDNVLINSLEKIKYVTPFEDIGVLVEALSNSLKRRTPPQGRGYPPKEVIKKYLLSSKYTNINGDVVSIMAEPENLTEAEMAVVEYMQNKGFVGYPDISSHLFSLGYDKPHVDKLIFKSPLIYVNKDKGRHHYKFRLIGAGGTQPPQKQNIYEQFRQRLLKASSGGTDGVSEITTRREHYILKEWLFKGKDSERCAICNKTYSVKSLVTAHKKRRADCAENERTDPYIVMPLCSFGCDYLYEKGLIYIDNGIIQASAAINAEYFDEKSAIKPLIGKAVEKRWLKGSESYFKKSRKSVKRIVKR